MKTNYSESSCQLVFNKIIKNQVRTLHAANLSHTSSNMIYKISMNSIEYYPELSHKPKASGSSNICNQKSDWPKRKLVNSFNFDVRNTIHH